MDFKQISDFIDLVNYPDKYKGYLNTLKEQKEGLDKAIATVGEASEIPKLKEQAQKMVEKAKVESEKIVDEAKASATKILDSAKDALKKAQDDADSASVTKAKVKGMVTEYEGKLASLQEEKRTVDKLQEKLLQMEKDYSEKEQELNERLGKLRSVMG